MLKQTLFVVLSVAPLMFGQWRSEPFRPRSVLRCLETQPILKPNFLANPYYFRADFSGRGTMETLVMVITEAGQRGLVYCSGGKREVVWEDLVDPRTRRLLQGGELGTRGLFELWTVLGPQEAKAALGNNPSDRKVGGELVGAAVFVVFQDIANVIYRKGGRWKKYQVTQEDSSRPPLDP
ncbi:MAG: hypothetical protein K2X03_08070 [Bryobacteraceae bacterium]|nr:hypothetical protein [Bryobacteraceae bacterium]